MSSFWHNPARPSPRTAPRRRRSAAWRLVLAGLILAGVATLIWSVVSTKRLADYQGPQRDYNNLLVDGFRQGHLWMDVEPPVALQRLANPWDPQNRVGVESLHDVSFYHGHYYLYFGAVPAALLFLPFRIVTGHALPDSLGYLVFSLGAFLLAAWLWLRILRDNFPAASKLTEVIGLLGLGLAGGQLVLARRVSIWEPSIAAGHFFLLASLAACYLALAARRPLRRLAVAGLALALAVGCRPTLAVAGLGMLWVVYVVGNRLAQDSACSRPAGWRQAALAGGVPLLLGLVPLLVYNWERFGSITEFGLHYQLTAAYEKEAVHFSAAFVPYNFHLYFTSWPQWGRYFPFVHPIAGKDNPAGYYGYENVYGLCTFCPLIWGVLLLPWLAGSAPRLVREFVPLLAVTFVTTCLTLLLFNTATARYVVDFLPWLLWLALLGWALGESRLGRPLARVLARVLATVVALASVLAAFFANCDLHDILVASDPVSFGRLSRVFNQPAAWWEAGRPPESGPVAMTVRFGAHPSGSVEPLVVTGAEYQKDYFYLFFETATTVRFGYARTSRPRIESAPVTIVPGRAYHLEFSCGSLYPPTGFPDLADWTPGELAAAKEWAVVSLDGRTVLEAHATGNEATPGSVRFGTDPEGIYGKRFSGTIDQVERLGRHRRVGPLAWPGEAVVDFTVPTAPWAAGLPLMELGVPGAAESVGICYVDPGHYVVQAEQWGMGAWKSDPLALAPDRHERLQIQAGALLGLPARSPIAILAHSLVVYRQDVPILWHFSLPLLPGPPPVAFLRNSIGSSILRPEFTGRLNSLRTVPAEANWPEGPCDGVALTLAATGQGTEPLVSTGVSGAGDLLSICWLGGGKACLIYDHWGVAFNRSEPFAWGADQVHDLRIRLAGLGAMAGRLARTEAQGPVAVQVDGQTVWSATLPYYVAAPATVAIGVNAISSSSASSILTAPVLAIHPLGPRPSPSGM